MRDQEYKVIPINIQKLDVERKLLYLKLFCLAYAFLNIIFIISSMSFIIGFTKNMKNKPNLDMYNVPCVTLNIFKLLNIIIMIYTKYFNYSKRNFFYVISTKGFLIYFLFLPALACTGVSQVLCLNEYISWINYDDFPFSLQYFVITVTNTLFFITVTIILIEYSRWKFQIMPEDLEGDIRDVREVVNLVLLNRYNIIITIIGLVGAIFDLLLYMLSMHFIVLVSEPYKVEYIFIQSKNMKDFFNTYVNKVYPCSMTLLLISVFYFFYRIKDYWYFVQKRKECQSMSKMKLSHLNLSSTTFITGVIIFSVALVSMLNELDNYLIYFTDPLRSAYEIAGSVVLVLLLFNMKDWKRLKKFKPLSDQMFLYSGFLGWSLININYLILIINGLNLSTDKSYYHRALIEFFSCGIYNILRFLFFDLSMTKIHVRKEKKEIFNLLVLFVCIQLSLSLLGFNKYLNPEYFSILEDLKEMPFTYQFTRMVLAYLGIPFGFVFEIYACGYCGLRICKWYGVFEDSSTNDLELSYDLEM